MRKSVVVPALLAVLLAACSSTPDSSTQTGASVEDRNAATSSSIPTVRPDTPQGLAALRDPRSPLSRRDIFFDYDSYVVKPEYQSLLEAHARFLNSNPSMKMMIQGNADERGSREYNLALGQKRADAVKRALSVLGVRESQLESVSLGEEKPRCTERTEDCFAQNRRGEMLYSGEF